MTTMSATDARAALPTLLDRVEAGDEVTITRHGRAVAVLVRPDTLRTRRAEQAMEIAASVRDRIAAARRTKLSVAGGLTEARAEDLIAEVRAGRDSH